MHGDLRTTSLEQLCRTLDAREATGELAIDGDGNNIRVWFRQGRVVRAAASKHELRLGDRLVHGGLMTAADLASGLSAQAGSGRPLGEVLVEEGLVSRHVVRAFMQEQVLDALFAAIRWTNGTYTFEDDDVPGGAVPTDLTVAQLLFALESRHRVWDEITRTIPDLDRVPEFVPGADPTSASRDPGESAIVAAINGERSVEQIAEELGFGPYEVAAVVHGLTVLGQVRLQQTAAEAPAADPASAAAYAISEAAAFLRGDGPAPQPVEAPAPAAPPVAPPAAEEPPPAEPVAAPEAPADELPAPVSRAGGPSSLDFAAQLADVMADLDVDGPRGGRDEPEQDVELAVLATQISAEIPDLAPMVPEDPAAGLPLPPEPGTAAADEPAPIIPPPAPVAATPPAPAPPAPAPAPAPVEEDEEETTFLIMDEDLSQEQPTTPIILSMDSRPAPLPGDPDEDESPEPWAFVIGGGDPEEEEAPRRRVPTSPITAAVADTATGTPLPTPTSGPPEPAPAPAPTPEPEPEVPAAPSRPRQTGEMSDLLRELRQLSDE